MIDLLVYAAIGFVAFIALGNRNKTTALQSRLETQETTVRKLDYYVFGDEASAEISWSIYDK